jgi:hypothetical protein
LLVILSLVAAVVAAAQPAAAPRPAAPTAAAKAIDPARMQAATQLVQLLGIRRQLEASMTQSVAAMKSGAALRQMLAQQPGFVQAYQADRARFDKVLAQAGAIQAGIAQKVVAANMGAVVDEATRAYARNFSTAELQGLIAFYQTPLGQALYQRQPRVSAEIGAATARIIGGKMDAAMRANASKIEAALAPLSAPPPAKK